jgi:hypothetical protein
MKFETILPVLTLLIGWFLSEFGNFFRERKEQRKVLGIAISDLLEIRSRLVAYKEIVDILHGRLGIPSNIPIPIGRLIDEIVPSVEDYTDRYEENLSLIAKSNPVLAYRLRPKYFYKPMISKIRGLVGENSGDNLRLIQLENVLAEEAIPKYDQLILELAKKHSSTTFSEVQKRLESGKEEVPPELNKLLSVIQSWLQKPQSDVPPNLA